MYSEADKTVMRNTYLEHPTEEALERFIMKRSSEDELEVLETHILACDACVGRLENLELQISMLKEALADFEADRIQKEMAAPTRSSWKSWLSVPTLSWAGAAVAALAIGVAIIPTSVPRSYNLSATRGAASTVLPEGKALDLHLDTTDIQQGTLQAEIVNASGAPVWKGSASVHSESAEVKVPEIGQSGTYFLRLYSDESAADRELLREYRFDVK
jgi:hypothetical protein